MQQCGEPYLFALSRRLAHGFEPVRRDAPAQYPDRGRLAAVSLGEVLPSTVSAKGEPALFDRFIGTRPRPNPHLRACASSACAFMSRPGLPCRTRMRPPRFRTKDVSTCMGSPTARGSSSPSRSGARMLPSRLRTGSAPRNLTRFAAQYPAHGLPCERFKLSLAASPCITRGRGGWLGPTP